MQRTLLEGCRARILRVFAAMAQHSGVRGVRSPTRISRPPALTMASCANAINDGKPAKAAVTSARLMLCTTLALFLSPNARLWRAPAAACRVFGREQHSSPISAGIPPASATTVALACFTAKSQSDRAATSAASGDGSDRSTATSCSSAPPSTTA